MRFLLCLLLFWPNLICAQSREVNPDDLRIEVSVVDQGATPYVGEMVMINIRGFYQRHITRENLEQPDFEGFSWTQLGPDSWREERVNGRRVKILERRMALYPERAGSLTIGAFVHHLTLTDEGDDWFDHEIRSAPITVSVDPIPAELTGDWWFPVRALTIMDQWSNAPDQLKEGDGVLRIIRLEAVGATPEMIPPMPELTSPSAMIFPHPEKRLVELSPEGPVTHAFWRWTIRPTNATSAIVEPLKVSFYDTRERVSRVAEISPQRIAYGDKTGGPPPPPAALAAPVELPGWPVLVAALIVFVAGLLGMMRGWRLEGLNALARLPLFDPLTRALKAAARARDISSLRRAATALLKRDGYDAIRADLLHQLDSDVFSGRSQSVDQKGFVRAFLRKTDQPKKTA